jgi:hypothetical protein
MNPINEADIAGLEAEFATSRREKMLARALLERVAEVLSSAEAESAAPSIIDRLDVMQIALTEAVKENVCTNTKCPHYNKKCRMR